MCVWANLAPPTPYVIDNVLLASLVLLRAAYIYGYYDMKCDYVNGLGEDKLLSDELD